jgi:hypothetical protein
MLVASAGALAWGMVRLVRRSVMGDAGSIITAVAPTLAGVLALCLPFTLTRLSTGHLTTLWALAVLPHLFVSIVDQADNAAASRTATIAALLGVVAGVYSLLVLLTASSRPAWWRVTRSWVTRNAVWLLPGVFLQLHGYASFTDPKAFRPNFSSVWEVLGLLVGRGYWDRGAEVFRGHDKTVAVVAMAMVAFAVLGRRRLPAPLRRVVPVCMAVGYGVPLVFASEGLGVATHAIASTPLGVAMREPHRLVGLGVVPLTLLAVLGVVELSSWPSRVPAYGGALLLLGSTCWLLLGALPTVHRRLDPLRVPPEWSAASDLVARNGGTVLALPWSEYVLLELDHSRPVYNPLGDLFGSETLVSSDPMLGAPVNEAADPRSATAAMAAAALAAGSDARGLLTSLRVRWIAVMRVEQVKALDLTAAPGLVRVISSSSLDLYEVVLTSPVDYSRPLPFFISGGEGGTDIPWTWGWVSSSGRLAGRTPEGLLATTGNALFLPALVGLALLGCDLWLLAATTRRAKFVKLGTSCDTVGGYEGDNSALAQVSDDIRDRWRLQPRFRRSR